MADGVAVRTNLPDFRRQLAELGGRIERRIVSDAAKSAGIVFRGYAQQLAPVLHDPGMTDLDDPDSKVARFLRYFRQVAGRGTLDPALVTVV